MRTGVILLTSSTASETNFLREKLQDEDVQVIQCDQNCVVEMPERITDFVTKNRLETVVVANSLLNPPSDAMRLVLEKAGLGHLAVSWVDLMPVFAMQSSGDHVDSAIMAVLVSIARQRHADYMARAVSKTVSTTSKVSRRELFRSIPKMFRVESDIPVVVTDRCKGRSDSCDYCRRACSANAISKFEDTVMISDRLCTECGACARECPIGALQCPSISDAQVIAMLTELSSGELETEERALMLTCPMGYRKLLEESARGRHIRAGFVPVQIPCVASIGSVQHLWSTSLGVTLVPVCPDNSCNKAVALSPVQDDAISVKNASRAPLDDRAPRMRCLVLDKNDSIVDSASKAIAKIGPAGKSSYLSGDSRRDLTFDGLRTIQNRNREEIAQLEDGSLPIFDLKVDDARCTFCESCQIDCADHAIAFTRNEDSVTLMFDPVLCSGCMICEKTCPEHAISLSRLRDFSSIFEKKKLAKVHDEDAKCEECGISLGSERGLVALRKRLSEQGVADAGLKALNLCRRCKQSAVMRRIGSEASY